MQVVRKMLKILHVLC